MSEKKKNLQQPGIEPGPDPWQGPILPLDYYCSIKSKKYVLLRRESKTNKSKILIYFF